MPSSSTQDSDTVLEIQVRGIHAGAGELTSKPGRSSSPRPPGVSSRSVTGNSSSLISTPRFRAQARYGKSAVTLHRHALADSGLLDCVSLGKQSRLTARLLAQQPAPWVNDRRMPMGDATTGVLAALCRRRDIALGLDGPRANQRGPVRLAGHRGKRRGHADQFRARRPQSGVQLGKAQVVTRSCPAFRAAYRPPPPDCPPHSHRTRDIGRGCRRHPRRIDAACRNAPPAAPARR